MGTLTTQGCSGPLPDLCPGTLGPSWAADFLQKRQHDQALSLLSGTEAMGCGAQRRNQEDLQTLESAQVAQRWAVCRLCPGGGSKHFLESSIRGLHRGQGWWRAQSRCAEGLGSGVRG